MTAKILSKRRRVVLVAGQKGGTGKSSVARALVDRCRRDRISAAGYDADGSVGQLLQFYGTRTADGQVSIEQDPLQGIGYFDLRLQKKCKLVSGETLIPSSSLISSITVSRSSRLSRTFGPRLPLTVFCDLLSGAKAQVRG